MDYSIIDKSILLNYLFYPRKEFTKAPEGSSDLFVPVEEEVSVHCRLYKSSKNDPWILYFHGNGEVVSDYDNIAPYYLKSNMNLIVADYRGYGKSGGSPTFTNLVRDAKKIFSTIKDELDDLTKGKSNLWVMGRSLGSISALELASAYPEDLRGMIIESGFISVTGLIKHLGLPSPGDLTYVEKNARQIAASITIPSLVIHGERDNLVPLKYGEELYHTLSSTEKRLFTIPRAAHNDIFFVETERYLQEIKTFIELW